MTCEECREGLSARLDGEDPGLPAAALDRHLAECTACRQWLGAAERLHRLLRISAADTVPDLSSSIVGALARRGALGVRRRAIRLARAGLVALAAVQVVLVVPELAAGLHDTHEAASWNLAVAAGFLLAALRPARAGGLVPVIAVAVAVLYAVTARDLLRAQVHVEQEVAHLVLLVGLVLLLVLRRWVDRPPGRAVTAGPLPRVDGWGAHREAA